MTESSVIIKRINKKTLTCSFHSKREQKLKLCKNKKKKFPPFPRFLRDKKNLQDQNLQDQDQQDLARPASRKRMSPAEIKEIAERLTPTKGYGL